MNSEHGELVQKVARAIADECALLQLTDDEYAQVAQVAISAIQQDTVAGEVEREAIEQVCRDMEYAVAGGMSWISEREANEFVRRLRAALSQEPSHE
jgi:hypothetical protein